ncbi:hypothetical protein Lepto1489_22785 (plasmid) [Leptospira interrogans serovar Bataviae]|uniref:Uncharacterized protein n=1 Tax=Leptospira interrogans serovar Bataviae TaxID=312175 RepID=A0AAQ0B4B3_LEPIR|nr:hypothetical protein Lepto1489_22785 [Leptospira interrogans serovar Bataviae]
MIKNINIYKSKLGNRFQVSKMNKCSPMSHKPHYGKLPIASHKNLLQTVFENHPSVSLNCITTLFSKLLGLIYFRVL